jgi:hypothetical protein
VKHETALKLLTTKEDPNTMIGIGKESADQLRAYVERLYTLAAGSESVEYTVPEIGELLLRIYPGIRPLLGRTNLPNAMRETAVELFINGLAADPSDVAKLRWIMSVHNETGKIPLKSSS